MKANPTKNMSNGPEAAKADKLRKKATSAKGKYKQPKGSSESGAKAKKAKMEKNLHTDGMF